MKKVLLSLLLAIACMPMALGQNKAGNLVTTDTTVCGKFTWVDGHTYTTDTFATYVKNGVNYVLNLSMMPPTYDTLNAIQDTGICSVTWNNRTWKTPGTFFDTLTTDNGCNIVKIQITLGGTDTVSDSLVRCGYYNTPWGDSLTSSVSFVDSTITTPYCNYHATLNLTINPIKIMDTLVVDSAECSYRWQNQTITDTLVHTRTFSTTLRCDSIISVRVLRFTNNIFDTVAQTACDQYVFHGDTLDTTGVFTHVDTANSCLSHHTIDLTIVNSFRDTANTVIEDVTGGCRISWLGSTYSYDNEGDTILNYGKTTVGNCDSLMAIHIVSFDSIQHDTTFVEYCGETYTWSFNNKQYTTDTIVHAVDTTAVACEQNNYLALTFVTLHDTITAKACQSYTYTFQDRAGTAGGRDRATFTVSGTYDADTNGNILYSTHRNTRCVTYHTVVVTVKEVEQRVRANNVDTVVCDLFTYSFAGRNNQRFTTSVDTTLTREIHLNEDPDNYCYDSIAHFKVTVKNKTFADYRENWCDSYLWPFTGETYTTSTTVTYTLPDTVNSVGCDSVGRLYLTINYTPEVSIVGNWHLHRDSSNVATLKVSDNPADHNTYKWFKNTETTPFSTSDSVSITVTDNTDIRLEATSNHGCTAKNNITITYTTGIDDVDGLNVSLYPNPASRFVNVESANGLRQVILYNVLGQQVINRRDINATATQLDLGVLTNGTYTLRIVAANGEQATRKIIVNK